MKLLFLFFLPALIFGQIPEIEELRESDVINYLKVNGHPYKISREEKSGIAIWKGFSDPNGNNSKLEIAFQPDNTGVLYKIQTKNKGEDYSFQKWKSEIPKYYKILEQDLNSIYAGDGTEISSSKNFSSVTKIKNPRTSKFKYLVAYGVAFLNTIEDTEFSGLTGEKPLNFRNVDTFDLYNIYSTFSIDLHSYYLEYQKNSIYRLNTPNLPDVNNVSIKFRELEQGTIAFAKGMNDDSKVDIYVNPIKWKSYSPAKRLFIIYHELGHDIFNFEHGEGGKMMFNYSDEVISWTEFIDQRKSFFENIFFKGINELKFKPVLLGDKKRLVLKLEKEKESNRVNSENSDYTFYDKDSYRQYKFSSDDKLELYSEIYLSTFSESVAVKFINDNILGDLIWESKYATLSSFNEFYILSRVVKMEDGKYSITTSYSYNQFSITNKFHDPNIEK